MKPRDLMALPPRRAIEARFLEGRARHGPHWQGDHPLLEAYVELVDLGVYVDVAEACGELGASSAQRIRDRCWPVIDELRHAVVRLETARSASSRPLGLVRPRLDALAPLPQKRWHRQLVVRRGKPNGGTR